MSVERIKKDDIVVAIAGRDKGKTGKVVAVNAKRGVVLVEGVNLVKKAVRRSEAAPEGGFVERPAPIAISNVMPWDAKAKKGVRISRVREGDRSVRVAKGTGTRFE